MIALDLKMIETLHAMRVAIKCHLDRCRNSIQFQEPCFVDTLHGWIYCHQCGLCLRFARKRAQARGEPIENCEV